MGFVAGTRSESHFSCNRAYRGFLSWYLEDGLLLAEVTENSTAWRRAESISFLKFWRPADICSSVIWELFGNCLKDLILHLMAFCFLHPLPTITDCCTMRFVSRDNDPNATCPQPRLPSLSLSRGYISWRWASFSEATENSTAWQGVGLNAVRYCGAAFYCMIQELLRTCLLPLRMPFGSGLHAHQHSFDCFRAPAGPSCDGRNSLHILNSILY